MDIANHRHFKFSMYNLEKKNEIRNYYFLFYIDGNWLEWNVHISHKCFVVEDFVRKWLWVRIRSHFIGWYQKDN